MYYHPILYSINIYSKYYIIYIIFSICYNSTYVTYMCILLCVYVCIGIYIYMCNYGDALVVFVWCVFNA